MAFGGTQVLAIELSSEALRIVHGTLSGQRLRVNDFAGEEMHGTDLESAGRQLHALIEHQKLEGSAVALALSGPGVLHRLLEFPSMPANELGLVVEREIKAMSGEAERDVAFDWEIVEESAAGNFKQLRILVALAPRAQIDGVQQLIGQSGLELVLLTTAPISLLRSLKFVQGESAGLRAVLYLGGNQGYLLGTRNGVWNFYREFSTQASNEGGGPLVEEALKEVHRVLLYRRQHYQSEGEMRFLLGGDGDLDDLQKRLDSEMSVPAEVARPGSNLDMGPLGGRAGVFRQLFPSLMIPIGLLGAFQIERGINLVPRAASKAARRLAPVSSSFVPRPILIGAIVLVFIAVHLYLEHTQRNYERILQERTALYQQWLPNIQAAETSRSLRSDQELLTQALGSQFVKEPAWVGFFKVLSRETPAEIVFQSMTVRRDKEDWLITLKGQAISPDAYAAQAAFNRFYQALKELPHLRQIELQPLTVTTLKERVAAPERKEAEPAAAGGPPEPKVEELEIKKTKVDFEIRGHANEI